MPAARHDIVIEEGADWQITFTYLDKVGAAISTSGFSARLKVKESIGGTLIDSLVSGGEITLGGSNGEYVIGVAASVTAYYDFDWGVYELEIVTAGGVVTRLVEGRVEFRREVTD